MDTKKEYVVGLGLKICLVVLVIILSPRHAVADTYEVVAIRGVRLMVNGRELGVGDRFDDKDAPAPRWDDAASEGGYVRVMNTTTRVMGLIVPRKSESKNNEPGFWERVKAYFSGIKKCSTRGEEGDDLRQLADRLSQTFYMLDSDDECVTVRTGLALDESHYLEAEYHAPESRDMRRLRFRAEGDAAKLTPDCFGDMSRTGARTVVRLSVIYVDAVAGTRFPLCDGMTVILVEP